MLPKFARPITAFRQRVRTVLKGERQRANPRHLVILAIDGVPWELAERHWQHAQLERMRSVFPTTSSSAWLSSLTGTDVAEHGIPGVVFSNDDGELINVYNFQGTLRGPSNGNIFSDARSFGFRPLAILGDWLEVPCSWRDTLVHGAETLGNHRFYSATPVGAVSDILAATQQAIEQAISLAAGAPALIWCFVELDRHVHVHGYDDSAQDFLSRTDGLARRIMQRHDCLVVAHSDHGLVPTSTSSAVAGVLEEFQQRHSCELGGAGRARWLYSQEDRTPELITELRAKLPSAVEVLPADRAFAAGSLARARVGEIVLIAREEAFLSFPGLRYDHGSLTATELMVPYAQWRAAP